MFLYEAGRVRGEQKSIKIKETHMGVTLFITAMH
jgi:hypothetical protein